MTGHHDHAEGRSYVWGTLNGVNALSGADPKDVNEQWFLWVNYMITRDHLELASSRSGLYQHQLVPF